MIAIPERLTLPKWSPFQISSKRDHYSRKIDFPKTIAVLNLNQEEDDRTFNSQSLINKDRTFKSQNDRILKNQQDDGDHTISLPTDAP